MLLNDFLFLDWKFYFCTGSNITKKMVVATLPVWKSQIITGRDGVPNVTNFPYYVTSGWRPRFFNRWWRCRTFNKKYFSANFRIKEHRELGERTCLIRLKCILNLFGMQPATEADEGTHEQWETIRVSIWEQKNTNAVGLSCSFLFILSFNVTRLAYRSRCHRDSKEESSPRRKKDLYF